MKEDQVKTAGSVLIIEDEQITADSIAELLTDENYSIAGVFNNGTSALEFCLKSKRLPEIALCDINIEGKSSGIETAKKLKELFQMEIVFLTAYSDVQTLHSAFEVDPAMYIVKPYNDNQLLVAIQMAFHKIYTRNNIPMAGRLILTDREKEILGLVANGLSTKQISHRLGISDETVKTHRKNMLRNNHVNTIPQLIYLVNGVRSV